MTDKCEVEYNALWMCDHLSDWVEEDITRVEEVNRLSSCPFCGADIRNPEE